MKTDCTKPFPPSINEDFEDESIELEAASFAEFIRTSFIGLGLLLLVSFGTYLLFSGVAVTLLTLIS